MLLGAVMFFAKFGYCEINEEVVESKIEGVTVYLNGAQITRSSKIKLKKGINRIQFNDVSPYLNPATLQVKGMGDYIILDAKKSSKYPDPKELVAYNNSNIPKDVLDRITRLEDSVNMLNTQVYDYNIKIGFLTTEKDFLLKNNVFTKDSLPILSQSLDFLRKRLVEIHEEQMNFGEKKKKIEKQVADLNVKLADLRNYGNNSKSNTANTPIHYVEVTVQAKQDGLGSMDIIYLVSNAGWSPTYDIRVENTSSPVELTMKASVYQNSGEEWEDVKLTLSTNNPFRNKVKPELSIWYLNYYNIQEGYYKSVDDADKRVRKEYDYQQPATSTYSGNIPGANTKAITSMDYTVKEQMMAHAEYKISLPYTVESNNEAHLVAVNKQTIKGSYYHYLVPRYDNESYIIAKLTDWEELDLLPSKANIFYDGSYIGETRINPTANDTLNISLGIDPNLIVKIEKNKEKTKDKVFSDEKESIISYDLAIKNKGLNDLNVIIEDQIPVALDKTIKISIESKSGALFDIDKGMLSWDFTIKGKESKKLNYTYKVVYDKEKTIDLTTL